MRSILMLGATALLLATGVARAEVWPTTGHWDQNAEAAFSRWIYNLPLDIFVQYKIPTDCADAAYTLRTIFAWENGLPVHFRLQDNQYNLSNDSAQFDSLETSQPDAQAPYTTELPPRVRAFITYVRNHTSTQTLVDDTYPIAINRNTLKPGILFLHNGERQDVPKEFRYGHTYYVQGVNNTNGLILYVSSTVPALVRRLSPKYGIDFAPWGTDSGYRAWKWPDSNDRPNASNEQYQLAGWQPNTFRDEHNLWERWQEAVQRRIRRRAPTAQENYQAARANLISALNERVQVVMQAWDLHKSHDLRHGRQCMNDADYDNYSTPTRDSHLQVDLELYRDAALAWINSNNDSSYGVDAPTAVNQLMSSDENTIEVYPGARMSFAQLYNVFNNPQSCLFVQLSEPEHSPAVRWGLEALPYNEWPCPSRLQQYQAALKACPNGPTAPASEQQPVNTVFQTLRQLLPGM